MSNLFVVIEFGFDFVVWANIYNGSVALYMAYLGVYCRSVYLFSNAVRQRS